MAPSTPCLPPPECRAAKPKPFRDQLSVPYTTSRGVRITASIVSGVLLARAPMWRRQRCMVASTSSASASTSPSTRRSALTRRPLGRRRLACRRASRGRGPLGGEAVAEHERLVLDTGGVVVRYGTFYGPGRTRDPTGCLRRRGPTSTRPPAARCRCSRRPRASW
jgi:hypothetical protein